MGRRVGCAAVAAVLAAACGSSNRDEAAGSLADAEGGFDDLSALVVYTVSYPLTYFAERIGGDVVRVEFPAPEDVDPAFWSPGAETVAAYQEADLILLSGVGYAAWVDRVSLPESRLVLTTAAVTDRLIVVEDAVTHTHGPEGEHAHGEIAFTTWLDPTIAIEQARAIRDAFAAARPSASAAFDEGLSGLQEDLEALDRTIAEVVSREPGKPLLASHPVYQYLAARYDLNLRSVHFEPDEAPSASAWRSLRETLEQHPAGWMLWESEPLPETAARLAELGVESVVFDPAGSRPAVGDYQTVMRENVRGLARAFGVRL